MKKTPLKRIIEQSGYKQEWIAQQAQVSANTLSRIVTGRHEPTLKTALRIAKILGVSVEELWGEDEP